MIKAGRERHIGRATSHRERRCSNVAGSYDEGRKHRLIELFARIAQQRDGNVQHTGSISDVCRNRFTLGIGKTRRDVDHQRHRVRLNANVDELVEQWNAGIRPRALIADDNAQRFAG
jgi:hypothetical protein